MRRYALSGLAALLSLFSALPTAAQIQPDETLGTEGSLVTEDAVVREDLADLVEGGATRGGNLFHSFLEFNVDKGQRVYFANPVGIESILSRVTGENPSNILGLLGVDGGADLFLMNPNGIVFGESATFDIEGSFYGTTGDAVEIGDEVFSAVTPESSRLLQVSPSILLENYLTEDSGDVESRGQLAVLGDLVLVGSGLDLQGQVTAGGDLTLFGLDKVRIRDAAEITSNTEGTGASIAIRAGSLEVINGAQLVVSVFGVGEAGNVILDIRETAKFAGSDTVNGTISGAFSRVEPNAEGSGGNIEIRARNLELLDGAKLDASTSGNGDAGNVMLEIVDTVRFVGANPSNGSAGGAFSDIEINGRGESGDIRVKAANLEVLDGAQFSVSSGGIGDAGNIIISLENSAQFEGANLFLENRPSGAFSNINPMGVGNSGTVQLSSSNLDVTNGSSLSASSFGMGNAGDVILKIRETAQLDGVLLPTGRAVSNVVSLVNPGAQGNAGNVSLTVGNLRVTNGAQILSSNFGFGSGGRTVINVAESAQFDGVNPVVSTVPSTAGSGIGAGGEGNDGGLLQLTANTLEITNGAQLLAATFGTGNAGDITISASENLRVDGINPINGFQVSTIGNTVQPGASGNGGDISIFTDNLEVTNGAQVNASTFGTGNAGNIFAHVNNTATFDGVNPVFSVVPSGLGSTVAPGATGNGGDVQLTTSDLNIINGAQLSAGTFGAGDAGDIVVNVANRARIVGTNPFTGVPSGILSAVEPGSEGNGGDVVLRTAYLDVLEGASVSSQNFDSGIAGNITISASNQFLLDASNIATDANNGSGGQIDIRSGSISLRNDGDIQTFVADGSGGGGDIEIVADFVIALEDSDILAFSLNGNGGRIDLSQTTLFSQNLTLSEENLSRTELAALDGNDFVDINAFGGISSGEISINDASFIENSLNELADELVDTAALTAGSCIASAEDENTGSFVVTGGEGVAQQPGISPLAVYPTDDIQSPIAPSETSDIQEAHGIYQLANGRLVLSHECEG